MVARLTLTVVSTPWLLEILTGAGLLLLGVEDTAATRATPARTLPCVRVQLRDGHHSGSIP